MKKLSIITMLLLAFVAITAKAQEETSEKEKYSFSASMNQDIFFGFYPTVSGSYQLSEKVSFGFYSIFWTTPSFSPGGNGGGLWTEWGPSVSIASGPLTITPALGILNGALLSNAFGAGASASAFEGLVPNLTVDLGTDNLEGQLYFGYYLSLGEASIFNSTTSTFADAGSTNNYVHWWAKGGYLVADWLSLGAGFEHLHAMPSEGDASDLYMWLGPYVSFKHPDGHALTFQTGADLYDAEGPADDEQTTFYKLSASFSF